MAAVGEHGELDAVGAPVVEEGVDPGPHGAPGVEDVVDDHHRAPRELEVEVGGVDDRLAAGRAILDVVAVEGDVEVAERDLAAEVLADQRVQPLRDHRPAGVDPDQRQPVGFGVLLDDLMGDPNQGSPQVIAIEYHTLFHSRLPGLSGPG